MSGALIIDQRTAYRNYPLPFAANKTKDDVLRLISALQAIDADIFSILSALSISKGKVSLESPTLSGIPKAPTAETGVNNEQIATTAFVHAVIAEITSNAVAEALV